MVLSEGEFRFVFTARDYDASVSFYRNGLELPLDHDWDYGTSDRGTVLHAGPAMIEIFGRAPGSDYTRPQGISMLIRVNDVDRWFQLAKQRKLNIVQEPTTFPWGHRILRLLDPDGITVSLFSPVEEPPQA
ncbi:MAG TPA: VOC family protein [Anaerolineaceae bacterium]